MKKLISIIITICFFSISLGQTKKEYQDPAYWIDLEIKKEGVPVKIISINGDTKYFKAPVKLLSNNTNRLLPLNISIDSIMYEAVGKGREIVQLKGKIDLSCCINRPVNIELIDKDSNLIQFSKTDNYGIFKLQSINGNILEIKNNKIKFNFNKIKTIDVNLDERYTTLERNKILNSAKINRLRKKEKLRVKDY
ncbi:MAG: hypothetical protein HKO81_04050 [Flavobacteriaceae bacterium]|nr:hypothetical protein [Bacteroidia bacterium]NNL15798.1 hypothetical protein [Flavobacteriaceae bacterium]